MQISDRLVEEGITIEPSEEHALVYIVRDKDGRILDQEEFVTRFGDINDDYALRSAPGFADRRRICAEGDSWINILWPASSILGHQKTLFDVIEGARKYDTLDLAYPGDTLAEIVKRKQYHAPIGSARYDWFLFSAAGNDVLGGGAIRRYLLERDSIDPEAVDPGDWIVTKEFQGARDFVAVNYEIVAKEINTWSSSQTSMLVHGYDYPVPRDNGRWLGKPLQSKGYDLTQDAAIIARLLKYIVDSLYDTLEDVQKKQPHVTVVDLRGTVAGRWNDELHPMTAASTDLAALFMSQIDLLS